jgi:transcriptional antiterminator RfaH
MDIEEHPFPSEIWYLIQLRPNGLKAAKINLERQRFKVFSPMQQSTYNSTQHSIKTTRPLFPGYLFVSVAKNRQDWRVINNTYGVSRLICLGSDGPAIIPDSVISSLMMRCDPEGILLPPSELAIGDGIKILQGPFAEILSKIENIDSDKRIWVLLDLLGRKTKVELSADNILKV